MEIEHKFVKEPMSSEFTMFYDQHKMFQEMFEKQMAKVIVRKVTKTRLSVSVKMGQGRYNINMFNPAFRLAKVEDWSMATHTKQVHHYFKVTKTQGLQELKQYVEDNFREVCKIYERNGVPLPDSLTLYWEETSPIRELQNKQQAA